MNPRLQSFMLLALALGVTDQGTYQVGTILPPDPDPPRPPDQPQRNVCSPQPRAGAPWMDTCPLGMHYGYNPPGAVCHPAEEVVL